MTWHEQQYQNGPVKKAIGAVQSVFETVWFGGHHKVQMCQVQDDLLLQAGVTEFRQPLQVQSHLEMPRILVQLGHTQRT